MDTRLNNEQGPDTSVQEEQAATPPPNAPETSHTQDIPHRRWPVILLCVLLVAAFSAALVGLSVPVYYEAQTRQENVFEQPDFIRTSCRDNYALYWKMSQRLDSTVLSPLEVFYPSLLQPEANEGDAGSGAIPDEYQDEPEITQSFSASLQNTLTDWYDNFQSNWDGYHYLVMDTASGQLFGDGSADLEALVTGEASEELLARLDDAYTYYVVMSYDKDGRVTSPALHGASDSSLDVLPEYDHAAGQSLSSQAGYNEFSDVQGPRSAVFAYAVPRHFSGSNATSHMQFYSTLNAFENLGFGVYYLMLTVIALVAGLLVARASRMVAGSVVARCPFEGILLVLIVALALGGTVARLCVRAAGGTLLRAGVNAGMEKVVSFLIVFFVVYIIFSAVYCAGLSLQKLGALGARGYFAQHSLVARNAGHIRKGLSRLYAWITRIDLTEKGNKTILKILIANFIILAILSTLWVFNIPLLILYSLILFFVLRRYLKDLKRQYGEVLDATAEIGKGRLDVRIEGDLGVFNPLKEELIKVQTGFSSAVEAETKSQNMKTELITNVSHDLKTPLTAIITYVDLLKQEDITEEERKAYLRTLDLKSQSLKRLIDDLFEMSRATSRDITLNITQVDLPALIRQVETEAHDALAQSGIELRNQFCEEHIVLPLDGDKTSRVFENLVMNVAKYGMRGTRAFLSIQIAHGYVYVELKNISQTELRFDTREITDRFVRGDLSRSTEGSGLGLAIAKSFVEAQGGIFAIATDGDMFKALVVFPCPPGQG